MLSDVKKKLTIDALKSRVSYFREANAGMKKTLEYVRVSKQEKDRAEKLIAANEVKIKALEEVIELVKGLR